MSTRIAVIVADTFLGHMITARFTGPDADRLANRWKNDNSILVNIYSKKCYDECKAGGTLPKRYWKKEVA